MSTEKLAMSQEIDKCHAELRELKQAVRIAHTALSYEFNPKSSSSTWDAHTEAGIKFMKLTIVKRMQEGEKNGE